MAQLTSWTSVRIAQDDVIWKVRLKASFQQKQQPIYTVYIPQPPGSGSVHYHRDSDYISEHFTHTRSNSVTVWMPLDDANPSNGSIEYAIGSHKWDLASNLTFHGSSNNYRDSVTKAALHANKPVNYESITAKAGDIVIHHQDTWHGSGPNQTTSTHRRTIVGHYLRGDVEVRPM